MARLTVAVLRGGTSSEYDLSLKTGAAMLAALPDERYDTRDILIDRSGRWHHRGIPSDPGRVLSQVDVVLNALHGGIGEDGTIQRILERSGVAYAGSRARAAAVAMNKARALEKANEAGILMPRGFHVAVSDGSTAQIARTVFGAFGPPYIIKPLSEGASRGIRIADTIAHLPDALGDALDEYGSVIVQEFVRGEDARVGLIEGYRNEDLYALPPVHVVRPQGKRFIDTDVHREGLLRHVVPSRFSDAQKRALMDAARAVHRALELSHFSRIDFILSGDKAYFLEASAQPGLYPEAAFPQMLESVGSSVREFLEHAIARARARV
jgi:D-alanine-D-alanine ligase